MTIWRLFLTRWWISLSSRSFSVQQPLEVLVLVVNLLLLFLQELVAALFEPVAVEAQAQQGGQQEGAADEGVALGLLGFVLLSEQGDVFLAEQQGLFFLAGLVVDIEFGHLFAGCLVEQGVFQGGVALEIVERRGVVSLGGIYFEL